jgi:hypothetical protein
MWNSFLGALLAGKQRELAWKGSFVLLPAREVDRRAVLNIGRSRLLRGLSCEIAEAMRHGIDRRFGCGC